MQCTTVHTYCSYVHVYNVSKTKQNKKTTCQCPGNILINLQQLQFAANCTYNYIKPIHTTSTCLVSRPCPARHHLQFACGESRGCCSSPFIYTLFMCKVAGMTKILNIHTTLLIATEKQYPRSQAPPSFPSLPVR